MKTVHTFLMFTGQAEAAVNFYVALFEAGEIHQIKRFEEGGAGAPGTVEKLLFSLNGQNFMAFDSPPVHAFGFTPSISIFVTCESEAEVDRVFGALSEGGQVLMPLGTYDFSARFGWCSDKFGVSWQVSLAG